jgi:hypothetical protein
MANCVLLSIEPFSLQPTKELSRQDTKLFGGRSRGI